jgi:hypothetical protein
MPQDSPASLAAILDDTLEELTDEGPRGLVP